MKNIRNNLVAIASLFIFLVLHTPVQSASAYYSPYTDITELKNTVNPSFVLHATVKNNTTGLHNFDWVVGACTPNETTVVASNKVASSVGCWFAQSLPTTTSNTSIAYFPPSIASFGDSFTQATNGQTPFPTLIQINTGITTFNQGAGGQKSEQIAVRQGAYNTLPIVTVVGGTIPTSGGVQVTFIPEFDPITNQGPTSLLASIGGVPGTLDYSSFANITATISSSTMTVTAITGGTVTVGQLIYANGVPPGTTITALGTGTGGIGTYTISSSLSFSGTFYSMAHRFTRTTGGSAVSVGSSPVPLVVNAGTLNNFGETIWVGRNNLNEPSQIMADIAAMVANLGSNKHFVIISIMNGSGEGIGTGTYNSVVAINSLIQATYPNNYIDLRGYLANSITINGQTTTQGLVDAKITPTSTDLSDIAANIVPSSLRTDSLHLNNIGYPLIANLVVVKLSPNLLLGLGTNVPRGPLDIVTPVGQLTLQSNGAIQGGAIGGAFTISAGSWTNQNLDFEPGPSGTTFFNFNNGAGGVIFGNGGGAGLTTITALGRIGVNILTPDKQLTVLSNSFGDGIHLLSNGSLSPTILVEDAINAKAFSFRLAGGGSVLAQLGGNNSTTGITHIQIGTDITNVAANPYLDITQTELNAITNDALTTTANQPFMIHHSTSGTAAAGFGSNIPWKLENASGSEIEFGNFGFNEATATASAEDANFLVRGMNAGTLGNLINFVPGKYIFGANNAYDAIFTIGPNSPYFFGPRIIDSTARTATIRIEGLGSAPGLTMVRTDGSPIAPTTVISGDNILALSGSAYNGTSFTTTGQILMTATETHGTNKGTLYSLQLVATGSPTLNTVESVWGSGHFQMKSATAPALSSCGTSPTISSGSSDAQGIITEGSVATACTLTFANVYGAKPSCTLFSEAGLVFTAAISTTTLIITNVGALSGTSVHYQCQGTG